MTDPSIDETTQRLFEEAIALGPEKRKPFLEERCDNAAIVEQVLHRIASVEGETDWNWLASTEAMDVSGKPNSQNARGFAAPQIPGYEIQQQLGRGGMGVVYKALHCDTNRVVALKIIRPEFAAHEMPEEQRSAVDRFRTEALAAAALDHPNIVTVYDVSEDHGIPYYAMKFVEGESLAEIVRERPLAPRKAAEYIESASRALAEAHECGVLHRDVKPHNVMIDAKSDQALVADFGLAKLRDGGDGATNTGAMLGTPAYMSPEQAIDASKVAEATDVYGLGATLYHVLTGRPPFLAAELPKLILQIRESEPLSLRALNADIDLDLETICLKCLEKDVASRYASAGQLADDLRRFLNDEPIVARRAGRMERFRKFTRRNRGLVYGTATAILALTIGLAAALAGMVWALIERETAIEKETARAKAVLATYVQAGDLAAQRGQWRLAQESYEQALAGELDDPIPIRIKRARMLLASSELQAAANEAASIVSDPSAKDDLADALLLLAETESTQQKGLENYRKALATENLNKADELYVRAVLAATLEDAIANAESAIELDPFRKDANDYLVLLYALSAQQKKLRDHITVLRNIFPEDPNYAFYDALMLALDGQPAAARSRLELVADRVSAVRLREMQDVVAALDDMSQLWVTAFGGISGGAPQVDFTLVGKVSRVAQTLTQNDKDVPFVEYASYPVLQPLVDKLPRLAVNFVFFPGVAKRDLDELIKHYPTHEILLAHGSATLKVSDSEKDPSKKQTLLLEVQESLQRAAESEQIITRQPPIARISAMAIQLELLVVRELQDEDGAAMVRERLRNNVRYFDEILREPNHRFHSWIRQHSFAVQMGAYWVGERDISRRFADIATTDNTHRDAHWLRARNELKSGDPIAAVEYVRESLKFFPDDHKLKGTESQAMEKLRTALEAFSDTPPSSGDGDAKPKADSKGK